MAWSGERLTGSNARRSRTAQLLVWNRRLHYYLGLYLLFFCWLFAITGLLLNHPEWMFAQFWPNRIQTAQQRQVTVSHAASAYDQAREVMRQFDLEGELQWPASRPGPGMLAFQLIRPGLLTDVTVDLATGRASVRRNDLNGWGVLNQLHTFIGVHPGDPVNKREWMLTTVWALSMDAVAAGLILMIVSSLIMWYRIAAERRAGLVALLLGVATCAAFILGFSWP
jgi:hypothetical protein